MTRVQDLLAPFPSVDLQRQPTPLHRLDRLSEALEIDLWIKRDDLTELSFGGNKTRQLAYYLGEAVSQGADTILITGAVQSNYARTAAMFASVLGMKAVLQLEERVKDMGEEYYSSGNVLLGQMLGAEHMSYPEGEDEAGADAALHARAEELCAEGNVPYVIHLGLGHPPLGALGYVDAADEVLGQMSDFDVAVVPSGSGSTHGGFLTGLKLAGHPATVHGICVRRDAVQQTVRIDEVTNRVCALLGCDRPFGAEDIRLWDGALPPGYGQVGDHTRRAVKKMLRSEGILLDPVYTGKTFAGLLDLLENGQIPKGAKVVMLHTGGTAALFAYEAQMRG